MSTVTGTVKWFNESKGFGNFDSSIFTHSFPEQSELPRLFATDFFLILLLLFLLLAEASFVGNNLPALFFSNRSWNEGNHSGPRTAIFDDPHEFPIFPFLVEFAVGEIPGAWVEHFPRRTLPIAVFPVTVNTGTFS